jgi:hypothetical protein
MEDQKERLRSPNYPTFGLSSAVSRVELMYKANGKASVHSEAAVKPLGYNSLNGRSLSVLGTLKQYGLIEYTGTKLLKPSQLALTILLSPQGSPQRRRALQDAARKPKVFADLFEYYGGDGIPGDDAMVSHLTLSTSFSQEAATRAIASFRETLDLLDREGVADSSPKRDDTVPGDDGDQDEIRQDTGKTPKRKEAPMPDAGRETLDFPFPMIGGGMAVLRVPRTMTDLEFNTLKTNLTAMLTGMKAALVPTVPPREAPDGGEEAG